jgi:hypothetical protein
MNEDFSWLKNIKFEGTLRKSPEVMKKCFEFKLPKIRIPLWTAVFIGEIISCIFGFFKNTEIGGYGLLLLFLTGIGWGMYKAFEK